MDILKAVLASIAGLVSFLSLLPFLPTGKWWVRESAFPRAQFLIVLVLSALPLALLIEPGEIGYELLLLLSLALFLYQLIEIFPYLPLAPIEAKNAEYRDDDRQITLLVSNVLMPNRKYEGLFRTIDEVDPDLILAVEVDQWWVDRFSELDERYPHRIKHPQPNTYGLVLFSRLPLENTEIRYLIEEDVPSVTTDLVLPTGDRTRLYALHPRPPLPDSDTEERDAELLMAGKMIEADDLPSIAFGDLNDVAWSRTTRLFQQISRTLDPRKGRGLYNSFHAKYFFLRYPLDHIFHSREFRLVEMRRHEAFGSDHFPISVTLSFEPEVDHQHEAPEAQPHEEDQAHDMIHEGREEATPPENQIHSE